MRPLRLTARIALLTALSLILFLLEGFLPLPLPVPGAKLGLAAIVTLVALRILPRTRDAAAVLLLRRTQLSLVGISAVGGLLHNMAQLLVAAAVMESSALLLYAPLLGVVGILTGTGIGILAQSIVKKINAR